jgi:large subunit ribosomal protein L10
MLKRFGAAYRGAAHGFSGQASNGKPAGNLPRVRAACASGGMVRSANALEETAMDRAQKEAQIGALKDVFAQAGSVIVTHNKGLTVAEMTDLRLRLREQGAVLKVVKNTLVQKAIAGTDSEQATPMFTGPVAIAYSPDPVAPAKVAAEFAKGNDNFVIVGGVMGHVLLDEKGVDSLAKLPSLDELRAKIVGMINTPATRIAGVLRAPAGKLARVVGAYAAKQDAA